MVLVVSLCVLDGVQALDNVPFTRSINTTNVVGELSVSVLEFLESHRWRKFALLLLMQG